MFYQKRLWTLKALNQSQLKTSGHEKTHYTVILACCADGTKLPPLLIFKKKMMPSDKIKQEIFIHVQAEGWMDKNVMKLQKV
jgi:hypothetical protein